ncbi:MAG: UbiA family prenyltransferase [Planctomycetota bacterium]
MRTTDGEKGHGMSEAIAASDDRRGSTHSDSTPAGVGVEVPLYVDLDGTLIATDTLWEALLSLVRNRPLALCKLPSWLAGGKAHFKRQIALTTTLNPVALPYHEELVVHLRNERARGRRLVLATACDEKLAAPIAAHLNFFDGVIASDGTRNLAGAAKLAAIQAETGTKPFEYAGNSTTDMPIFAAAHSVLVVSNSASLVERVRALKKPHAVYAAKSGGLRPILKTVRLHQWAKNLLLFVPLLAAHQFGIPMVVDALLGFLCFGLAASGGYVFNDLLDLEADRLHPQKRNRALASGKLEPARGVQLCAGLLVGSALLAVATLPLLFTGLLVLYLAATISYSLYFKRKLLADVILLAGLYTLRVFAGGAAIDLPVSQWLMAFSMFFFLSLAFAKRHSELSLMLAGQKEKAHGRAYRVDDLDLLLSMGPSCGLMAVLVLCLYFNSDVVQRFYPTPGLLWFTCPVLFYWLGRVWFLARRGELPGDPVSFALTDKISLIAGALVLAIAGLASFLRL